MNHYDIKAPKSIEKFGKLLEKKTLRNFLGNIDEDKTGNKGRFGQILEQYFGIEPTNSPEPDFAACDGANVELNSTLLKKSSKGLQTKERFLKLLAETGDADLI